MDTLRSNGGFKEITPLRFSPILGLPTRTEEGCFLSLFFRYLYYVASDSHVHVGDFFNGRGFVAAINCYSDTFNAFYSQKFAQG